MNKAVSKAKDKVSAHSLGRDGQLKWGRALGLVAGAALLLSACNNASEQAAPEVTPPASTAPSASSEPADLQQFYGQKLAWEECDKDYRCANLKVPMDYANPSGESAEVALKMHPATGKAIGTLVVNPGGPGGSGIETVEASALTYFFSPSLIENYNILGFDPRGVGQSKPAISCRSAAELDEDNAAWYDLTTPAGQERAKEEVKQMGEQCQKRTGSMAQFANTDSTARDLDIMRAALGEEQLHYFGFSYGTYLGAIYADLFPQRVGRMVLDGVMDPSLQINDVVQGQLEGFEAAITEFSKECQEQYANRCPLSGGTEAGAQQVHDLLVSLQTAPLQTSDPARPLTRSLATTGIMGSLYSHDRWFDALLPALNAAFTEYDGSKLLILADWYNSRNSDGTYKDNSSDAFSVINFNDYTPSGTLEEWNQQAAENRANFPVFGDGFNYASLGLDQWPFKANPNAKRRVDPATGPVLLVGTTGDPATPYQWAKNLHEMWKTSELLTYKSFDHTAYNSSAPACVLDTVDNYLLTGTIEIKSGSECGE